MTDSRHDENKMRLKIRNTPQSGFKFSNWFGFLAERSCRHKPNEIIVASLQFPKFLVSLSQVKSQPRTFVFFLSTLTLLSFHMNRGNLIDDLAGSHYI